MTPEELLRSDAFLDAHVLREGFFDISVGVQPASIRDQITRGALMAARAFETGLINTTDAHLLVVGAGAAGATCAITAAGLGVHTTLIDRDVSFGRQRSCNTKIVEPTFYDWPAPYWTADQFPWNGETLGLSMIPTSGAKLAAAWERRLNDARTHGMLNYFERSALVDVPTARRDGISARIETHHEHGREERQLDNLGIVVFATGPGAERDIATPGHVRSYAYWEDDPLSENDLACKTILISGGGDGALQDFLRAVFYPNVRPSIIVEALDLEDAQYELYSVTQHAAAAYLWWGSARTKHDSERFVEEVVQRVAQRLWTVHAEHIARVFNQYRRMTIPQIVLVHPCDHFTRSFLVNRLLVSLVFQWASAAGIDGLLRVQGRKVVVPECDHAATNHHGGACYPHPHGVKWYPASCTLGNPVDVEPGVEPQLVLLRHGVIPKPAFAALYENDPRRLLQILPPHLGHESVLRV